MPSVSGADGNEIAYEIEGSGADLILIHGITEDRSSWGGLRSRLAELSKVISVDLRGHGNSAPGPSYSLDVLAADVKAVADHVGAARPTMVGHSLGGFVASVYGAAYPTHSVLNVDQPLALAGFKEQLSEVEVLLRGDQFEGVIAQLFEAMVGPLPDGERARISQLRSPDQDVVMGVWDPVFSMSVEELDELSRSLLTGLEAPYLTILGEDLGPEYAMWLRSIIPHAEIEVWAGDGHYPHLMEPERFVTCISERIA